MMNLEIRAKMIKQTLSNKLILSTQFILSRDCMKKTLQLPSDTVMEYKAHKVALEDGSSFRNAMQYR